MKNKLKSNRFSKILKDDIRHLTLFESVLNVFLTKDCSKSEIDIEDMKDIIWNENDHNLISRCVFAVAEENPKANLEEIMQMFNEAWNYFPHKRLNGLSPDQMSKRLKEYADFKPEERPDFYEIFSDSYPEQIGLKKMRKNEWSWEYSANYHSFNDFLKETENNVNDNSENNDNEIDREFIVGMNVMAAKNMLKEESLLFEAAILLSKFAYENNEIKDAINILENCINKAREVFPKDFSLGKDLLPWGFLDNRPYLSVLAEYASLIEAFSGCHKAIPLYEEIIALNPNDNQGVRDILATAFLKTGQLENLLKLDQKYPDDMMIGLQIGTILALYKLGKLDEAKKRIKKLEKRFKIAFEEILKSEHPQPKITPGRVLLGGADEAWFYWEDQGTMWMATHGAREFLKETLNGK
jgi:hypothetical protein